MTLMTLSITASVGENGTNIPLDVAQIQVMLTSLPVSTGAAPIDIDGICGSSTIATIRAFQRTQLQMEDGLIQSGDYTMKRLVALLEVIGIGLHDLSFIDLKNTALKAVNLDLGNKVSDLEVAGEGFEQVFDGGRFYGHPAYGAFEVHGLILSKYIDNGGPLGVLGFPISDEREWVSGGGRVGYFEYGSLYYTDATGVTLQMAPGR